MMLRFHKDEVQPKGFFSLQSGYNEWETLNNQYQAKSITFLRGWNRALINFAGKLQDVAFAFHLQLLLHPIYDVDFQFS